MDPALKNAFSASVTRVLTQYNQINQNFVASDTSTLIKQFTPIILKIEGLMKNVTEDKGLLDNVGELCKTQCGNKGNK
jgi:hypothetical protein